MLGPKELIYRYDGDPDSEEILIDLGGTIPVPAAHDTIMRKGRAWKVAYTDMERSATSGQMPIVSVFLIEKVPASTRAA